MHLDKEALRLRLLEQYTKQLDEALEQLEVEQALDLTEIEEFALKLRHQVGQSTTEALAVVNASQQQAVDVYCPSCQARTRYKGRKKKWIKTRCGAVQVKRPYYYCEHCRTGHFPPG